MRVPRSLGGARGDGAHYPAVGQPGRRDRHVEAGRAVPPPPQQFNVTLPAAISNGVPAAGAGDLETTASENVDKFTTAALAGVQVTAFSCVSSLLSVDWKLIEADRNATRDRSVDLQRKACTQCAGR